MCRRKKAVHKKTPQVTTRKGRQLGASKTTADSAYVLLQPNRDTEGAAGAGNGGGQGRRAAGRQGANLGRCGAFLRRRSPDNSYAATFGVDPRMATEALLDASCIALELRWL